MAPAAKKITLKSSDGKLFKVDAAVAMESQTIRKMIEEGHSGSTILLPHVASKILTKVIEYCKAHAEAAPKFDSDEELEDWDAEFIDVDNATLFDLVRAAHYLDIESLRNLACETVDDMLKGKTPQEFHDTVCMLEAPAKTKKRKKRRQW